MKAHLTLRSRVMPRHKPLGNRELSAMRDRLARTTPGPWIHRGGGFIETPGDEDGVQIIGVTCFGLRSATSEPLPAEENAEFITHARKDIPRLLNEVERLRALLQAVARGEVSPLAGLVPALEASADHGANPSDGGQSQTSPLPAYHPLGAPKLV